MTRDGFQLQEAFMKRSVYIAGTVVACKPGNASSATRKSQAMAYYIFLAGRDTAAHTDHVRWFGPFATMALARMIRTSALSFGLAVEENAVGAKQLTAPEESQWPQLASA
jgi:hypothetical protein